ncbi:FidL-like protein [Serratia marcescens]
MAKKIIRAALVILILILSIIIYKQSNSADEAVRCQVDTVVTDMLNDRDMLSYEMRMNYIFNAQKESVVNMTGYVIHNNNRYRYLRTLHFMLDLSDSKDIYNIRYTLEQIHPSDNTPKDISHLLMSSQFDGSNSHIRINKIKGNTYLINGISQPIALCYRY